MSQDKDSWRFRHFVTQTLYQTTATSVWIVLSLPGNYKPGVVFHYHDGAPHLVSAAIQKRCGKPFSEFADQHLFQPVGITDWKWEAHRMALLSAHSVFI